MFTRKVLLGACEECGGEEEPAEPEAVRRALVLPLLHELNPALQVDQPVGERFGGEEPAA